MASRRTVERLRGALAVLCVLALATPPARAGQVAMVPDAAPTGGTSTAGTAPSDSVTKAAKATATKPTTATKSTTTVPKTATTTKATTATATKPTTTKAAAKATKATTTATRSTVAPATKVATTPATTTTRVTPGTVARVPAGTRTTTTTTASRTNAARPTTKTTTPTATTASRPTVSTVRRAAVAGTVAGGAAAMGQATKTTTTPVGKAEQAPKGTPGGTVQVTKTPTTGKTPTTPATGKLLAVAVPLEDHVTYQYNALGRRDPYSSLLDGEFVGEDVGGGAPPDVGGIKVVGIMWGSEDQFAMVEDVRGDSYVLRRGDKVMNGFVEGLQRDALIVNITVDGQSQSVTVPITRKGDKTNASR